MEWLEELNPEQRAAVEHGEGPLLLLAGAGSGKTRVLTYRIAYLITRRGVSAGSVLALTFTNKAAQEMRERLGQLLPWAAGDLWVMTFHAAGTRILRQEIQHLGRSRDFTIYDEDDRRALVRECLRELNLDEQRFPPTGVVAAISWAKNWLVTPEAMAQTAQSAYEEKVAQVFAYYQRKLEHYQALDFDDLLVEAVRLFREHPKVLSRWQQRFRYLLVDEYQDTNHAQYVWLHLLAQGHRNLTVVGDPDQAIYGWRGADIRNILSFERDYPEARVIKLERNYRSTAPILALADAVIQHNEWRKEKCLRPVKLEGELPVLHVAGDELGEANYVADTIKRLREQGYAWRDFAVLYRTNAQSRVLEEVFLIAGIPYFIVGGLQFYARKEVKDMLAYLRLLVQPADALSLKRVINVPARGVGEGYYRRLLAFASAQGITPIQALLEVEAVPSLPRKVKEKVRELGELLAELGERTEGPVKPLLEEVLSRTGYRAALLQEGTPEALARLENLEELLSVAWEYDREEGGDLTDFLASVALFTEVDRYDPDKDAVALMTLHSAKGLEFPVLFLTGMEEGLFPHYRCLEDRTALEEERRLCYVGITRARERLYLVRSTVRRLYGDLRANPPSRFLEEIPAELYRLSCAEGEEGEASDWELFSPGDWVRHRKWGEGRVLEVKGGGEDKQLVVSFPAAGVKTLLLAYAPVERLVKP
ncbi:ATP-dependent helicase [Desulfothermobacter acidiphilus]|uniref:ATP-dependent helicase n=1 Tax=Desulfothermobacter acidiphilus TaxID=1938353 RepID=UPI003F8BA53D